MCIKNGLNTLILNHFFVRLIYHDALVEIKYCAYELHLQLIVTQLSLDFMQLNTQFISSEVN